MAQQFIQSFTMSDGTRKQYDYEALGNKPTNLQETLTDTDGGYGQRVKALEDALADVIDVETQNY